jgi:hypothetical protein
MIIEAWDTGAYRDVREIWERAELLADKFKTELIRGLNALTGHLEYAAHHRPVGLIQSL